MKYKKKAINTGAYCPFCNSTNIASDSSVQLDGANAYNIVNCIECYAIYKETYVLMKLGTIKEPRNLEMPINVGNIVRPKRGSAFYIIDKIENGVAIALHLETGKKYRRLLSSFLYIRES